MSDKHCSGCVHYLVWMPQIPCSVCNLETHSEFVSNGVFVVKEEKPYAGETLQELEKQGEAVEEESGCQDVP